MKQWFDLAAERHGQIKEALIGSAALGAGKALARLVSKNKAATLGAGLTAVDAASAASTASRGVQAAHDAARQMASRPQTWGTM